MRRNLTATIVFVVLPMSSALAVQPARHDVAWYRAHANERASVLAMCQNDHSYDDAADCRNATSAAQAAASDSVNTAVTAEPEADPAYYGHNGPLIAMTLSMCSRKAAPQSWCRAAKIASAKLKQ